MIHFPQKRSYKMHVALVHEQDIRYKCELCEKGFPYKSMLERHKESHKPVSNLFLLKKKIPLITHYIIEIEVFFS
jgi:transposase-like protein